MPRHHHRGSPPSVRPRTAPSAEDDEFEPEIDGDVEEEIEGQDTAELQAPSDHRSAESDEPGGDRRRRRRRRRRGRERDERSPASVSDGEEASSETLDDFGSVISADASEDSGDLPVEAELERDLAETADAGEMPAPADRQDVGRSSYGFLTARGWGGRDRPGSD